MVDLFDFTTVEVSSGPVPRTLLPGIVWDANAEAEFKAAHAKLRESFGGKWRAPEFADTVMQEARWAVEISLHQRFIKARVVESRRVFEPAEKRALVAKWRELYGASRADELVRACKDMHLRKTVLETW